LGKDVKRKKGRVRTVRVKEKVVKRGGVGSGMFKNGNVKKPGGSTREDYYRRIGNQLSGKGSYQEKILKVDGKRIERKSRIKNGGGARARERGHH